MKKILFALMLLLGSLFIACEKKSPNPEIFEPSFSVEAQKSTVGRGEDVVFQFSSVEADQIVFFPGEEGSRYGEDSGWLLKTAHSTIKTYSYTYDQPGTYTATFVASNQDKHIVKELEIVVTLEPSAPDFDIVGYAVESTTDDHGNPVYDVTFSLQGDANLISFYSGQFGNDYRYKDGRLLDYDALNLSFDTQVRSGSQPDQFSIHISTDFNGEYTYEGVSGADWTDITEGFLLGPPADVWISSETKNIIAYKEDGKPLYIAFKYTYRPPPAAAARTWRVNDFTLSGITTLGEVSIADQWSAAAAAEWTFVSNAIDDNNPITRSRIESSARGRSNNIFFQYGNHDGSQAIGHDTWCISKAFEVDGVNHAGDEAVLVKQITDPQPTTYRYNYTEPGTYEVVFVAINVGIDNVETKTVKTIQITIP